MNSSTVARLLTGAAVTGLVLAGCGGDTDDGTATGPGSAGSSSAPATAQGEHNPADVAFAQGMIPHHRQAVEMAEQAASRTENPEVLDLAARIGAAQGPEIAIMTGWLQEWGAEVPEPGAMDGMSGMDGMDRGGMGGMMTPEEMTQLGQASGAAFDRMFLEMMSEHHRGAVEMAQVELDDGSDPEAMQLAQNIVDTQQAEITEMEELLQQL